MPVLTEGMPGYEVELVFSPIADMRGVAGYHTSVLLAGLEYFYGGAGIVCSPKISSHKKKSKMQRICVGISTYSGAELLAVLREYFPPGQYDLLRKNCNAFSDCALYFLCGQRLSWSFKGMDQIGIFADQFGLIQSISAGEYCPNPKAADFDVEAVILELDAERTARKLLELARALPDTGGVLSVSRETKSPRTALNDLGHRINRQNSARASPIVKPLTGLHNLGEDAEENSSAKVFYAYEPV
jgi:hypothetical protein